MFNSRLSPWWSVPFGVVAAATLAQTAGAQVTVYGSLSNFDCPNETDEDCDEFEIELHGPHPEDVMHTYRNSNYGSPTVEAIPGGTLVRYSRPHHRTLPGTIEHFGIHLRNNTVDPSPSYTWKANGHVAGLNPYPLAPQVTSEAGFSNEGDPVIIEHVTNVDPYNRRMWIKRSVANVVYRVSLEELMPDNDLVTGSTELDLSPVLLGPGQTISFDQLETGDSIASAVINYEIFRDAFIFGNHRPGASAGSIMNAIQLNGGACPGGGPEIVLQPVGGSVHAFGEWELQVDANGTDGGGSGGVNFQWYHEGVAIDGGDGDTLTLSDIVPANAGSYYGEVTDDCGTTISDVAYVTVIACPGDYNQDGFVDGFDYDEFVSDFEDGSPRAEFNQDGFLDGFDYDDFIAAFESAC